MIQSYCRKLVVEQYATARTGKKLGDENIFGTFGSIFARNTVKYLVGKVQDT